MNSLISRIRNFFFWPRLEREDCPHFNIDGDGKCNLTVEPQECTGYCRTLKVYRL